MYMYIADTFGRLKLIWMILPIASTCKYMYFKLHVALLMCYKKTGLNRYA